MSSEYKTKNATAGLRASLTDTFSFPHPVNEIAARLVAFMVMSLTIVIMISNEYWLLFILTYGFLARVLTGPTLSPMGLVATKILVPLLGNHKRLVPGPPKRFAQIVGLAFSTTAIILVYSYGLTFQAEIVLGILATFAALESLLAFCAGCFVFGYMMRLGLVPKKTCQRCADFLSVSVGSP
jgi:hypothetical protein